MPRPQAPSGIAAADGGAWVAGDVYGLFRIDAATGRHTRVPLGSAGRSVAAGSVVVTSSGVWTAGAQVHRTGDPANPWAFSGGGEVVGVDPRTLSVRSTQVFPGHATEAGSAGNATVIGATGGAVLVFVNGYGVVRINPDTGSAIEGAISVPGLPLAVEGGAIWSADAQGNLWRTAG